MNSEFMRELHSGAPQGSYGWVCNFIGEPRPGADWGGRPYRGGGGLEVEVDTWQPYNTYFSVAARSGVTADGEEARRKALFARLLALLVDDANPDDLQGRPSWILETSPGKNQVGILLDASDPDCADQHLVDAVMRVLFDRGLIGGDRSGNNGVRYGRLPLGSNLKTRPSGPWRHAMRLWNPGQRLSLADALSVVGVDIDDCRSMATAEASAGMPLGPGASQDDRVAVWMGNVLRGVALHDSLNALAASLIRSGLHAGAAVNVLRGAMTASMAPRDARFQERWDDIPRAVRTAEQFRAPVVPVDREAEASEPLLVGAAELMATALRPIQWLVMGYLEQNAISMTYGKPGSGKSFVVLEQALCIAAGLPWHGRITKNGLVILVVGEGHAGVARRIAAWCVENKVDPASLQLQVTRKAVPLLNEVQATALVDEIRAVRDRLGVDPVMVAIDTLARNFGDADENNTQDANRFIAVIDVELRQRWKCHVSVVHHSGHTEGRARGSSAFKGAVDQEFEVRAVAGFVVYQNKKMKDGPPPREMQFQIKGDIYVGDYEGEPIVGAVLKLVGGELDAVVANSSSGKAVTIFDVLKAIRDRWVPYSELSTTLGLSIRTAKDAVSRVASMGKYIEKDGNGSNAGWKLTEEASVMFSHTGEMVLGDSEY